jgi:chloramphenicol-sensitive protein RarD
MTEAQKGVAAIILACSIWGFAPLYYHALAEVGSFEMMAHRTIWTAVMFGLVATITRRWSEVRALLTGPDRWRILAAAAFIAFNWYLFIWAITADRAVEASLGYYIYPLVSALLGVVLFGEALRGLQAVAIGLAALAVACLTWGLGVAPMVVLALAVSFACYSAAKKRIAGSAMISVLVEVLIIAPPLVALLLWLGATGRGWFGRDLYYTALLPLAGPLSGGPLMLFSYGAQRVKLATSGLTQYLNPTLQFLSAWLILREAVTIWHAVALALVWAAIASYSLGRR